MRNTEFLTFLSVTGRMNMKKKIIKDIEDLKYILTKPKQIKIIKLI